MGRIKLFLLAFLVPLLVSRVLGAEPVDDLRVYQTPDERKQARSMLQQYLGEKMQAVWEARERELDKLKSPEAWRARQERTRGRLAEILGDFGEKCPLDARIVGKLDRPDYVIEKLIFQSQPKYYCTANVYVPKHRPLPQPGVLFTCGHAAEGKASRLYHEACLGLVLKGYVVLALDPTGQGERSEYFEPETGKPLVPLCVSQHHYLARPSWLVGRSLAGYRTWDTTRAVDYLVTRPEVDAERIGVVGNSGGGIMALLATAADTRIKVCAAAHPGGSMEETYLAGKELPKADLLSLIAPRPCLFIVGRDSGEESGHRRKMDWMRPFYRGLGAGDERLQMVLVDGVHDMKQPKREPAYGWLNRWFGKEAEGSLEPPLTPETPERLRCTSTGYTLRDLGSASGQTHNAVRAESLLRPRPVPEDARAIDRVRAEIGEAVRARIGLRLPERRGAPPCAAHGTVDHEGFTAERLVLESEPAVRLPALLLRPKQGGDRGPLVLHISDEGKPAAAAQPSLALELVRAGQLVFSLDVRGAGETDPRDRPKLLPLTRYDPQQFQFDSSAVATAQLGTTLLAMQTFDVIRGLDWIASRDDLAGRPVVLVGEGLGGVWALASAAFDPRPAAVACVRTVPSYRLITGSRYYACRDYFWVPRALQTFDLPDLASLVAPRRLAWIDPADAMLEPLPPDRCQDLFGWPRAVYAGLGSPESLRFSPAAGAAAASAVDRLLSFLRE
jgi:cephalosporin-C deacetylase-like acetyl esterase